MRRFLLLAALVVSGPAPDLLAQGLSASLSATFEDEPASVVALGYDLRALGPARVTLAALRLGASNGDRWGAGFDLALRFGARARLYPVAGLAAGWGSGQVESTWGGWSAGLGYDLLRGGRVSLAVEGRFLRLSNPGDALMLGGRVGYRFGRSNPSAAPVAGPGAPPNPTLSLPPARSALAAAVVESALEVMGTPYLWGGSDANGFDCSGLIRYAFGRHGVSLPRVSRDQARAGVEVARDTASLELGDILSFSDAGGEVSHVGLYVGDGRFIHSSSRGVVLSRLDPADPDGGYWWRRWRGVRRILP